MTAPARRAWFLAALLVLASHAAAAGPSRPSMTDPPKPAPADAATDTPKPEAHAIDLTSGDIVHWLRIEGVVEELYDVVALPGAVRPMALGFKTDEIRRFLNVGDPGDLVHR